MARMRWSTVGAMMVCGAFGVLLVAPGCDTLGLGGSGGEGGTGGGGDDDFTGIDAQILDYESLRAAALAYYLLGDIASSPGVDASTDQATLEGLAAQDAQMAEATVGDWLATIDPSAIATASLIPRYECTEQYQCPYKTQCFNEGAWSSALPYQCAVVNCGSSKCSECPGWFPDFLKSLVFDSWCSYVCAVRLPPRGVVAVGAVGMRNGKPFPAAGAWCFKP